MACFLIGYKTGQVRSFYSGVDMLGAVRAVSQANERRIVELARFFVQFREFWAGSA